jgi:ribulose-5-phosphate 4-epimerase/fuculose-1-phosphate aldolase
MEELVALCRACSVEELAQAGGGNISVKDGQYMYIKASGVPLCDIKIGHGIAVVDPKVVIGSLDGPEQDIGTFALGAERPSLETYFHAFLRKYVVHLHPTHLNKFLCSDNLGMVDYYKPGFELSKKVLEAYVGQSVIYLRNHGVIYHADTFQAVVELFKTDELVEFWDIQSQHPKEFIYRVPRVSLPIVPLTPDIVLFLHDSIVTTESSSYIRGPSKAKCLAIAEVLRSYVATLPYANRWLSQEEVGEILNWDAEAYRKNLVHTAST